MKKVMKNVKRHHGSRWIWKTLSFILYSLLFSVSVQAQTFTQRIQQNSRAGEGKVTISQDKAIDDLVNGKAKQTETQAAQKPETSNPQKPETSNAQKPDDKPVADKTDSQKAREQLAKILEGEYQEAAVDSPVIDTRRKVMRGGYKTNGYRVQAFAGGNQRKDRQKAEQVGNTIKQNYPEVPIYVHFYSPRWICRVGNYRTYEEAHQMLLNIRKLGITGASIVKGKITVQY
jgi:hypothetical protein